jgi:hypothetical protein
VAADSHVIADDAQPLRIWWRTNGYVTQGFQRFGFRGALIHLRSIRLRDAAGAVSITARSGISPRDRTENGCVGHAKPPQPLSWLRSVSITSFSVPINFDHEFSKRAVSLKSVRASDLPLKTAHEPTCEYIPHSSSSRFFVKAVRNRAF